MGLMDKLGSAVKSAADKVEEVAPGLISSTLAKTGDLQGMVEQLQKGGLNEQVKSWLGNGANLPVTPEQIRAALGNQQVQELAKKFGLPVDAALKLLSERLPAEVDEASPNGQLPSEENSSDTDHA